MTSTDDLIDRLARDGAAPGRVPPARFVWLAAGALMLSLLLLALALGAPLAALPALGLAPYAMKLAFTLAVALAALAALWRAGKPGEKLSVRASVLAMPFAAVLLLAGFEIATLGPAWPGATWLRCTAIIGLLGLLCALIMAHPMRAMAPTRLRQAGAFAGVAGGGIAATAYALWCPETTALFLVSWYALPILALGGLGTLLGPRLMRW